MTWIVLVVLLVLLGMGLWRMALWAKNVEADSGYNSDSAEGNQRAPYGSLWLGILRGDRDA